MDGPPPRETGPVLLEDILTDVTAVPPQARKMLRHLLDLHGFILSRSDLLLAVFGGDPDGGPIDPRVTFSVNAHYIRPWLRPGCHLMVQPTRGYSLHIEIDVWHAHLTGDARSADTALTRDQATTTWLARPEDLSSLVDLDTVTPSEFRILAYLYAYHGTNCSKDALGALVERHSYKMVGSQDGSISRYIHRLRTKIVDTKRIETVTGYGYRLRENLSKAA